MEKSAEVQAFLFIEKNGSLQDANKRFQIADFGPTNIVKIINLKSTISQ